MAARPGNIRGSGKKDSYALDAQNRKYTTPQFNTRMTRTQAPSSRTGGSQGKQSGR